MPRRDGDLTITENVAQDAPAVFGALVEMGKEHGYYGEPLIRYIADLLPLVLAEALEPKNLVRILERPNNG